MRQWKVRPKHEQPLVLEERSPQDLGAGEVRIRVHAAALKQVIIIDSMEAGFPPLLKEDAPERLEIAPALTVRRELGDSSGRLLRERRAASRDRPL